jgi:membrane protein required for colicin V production
MSAVDWAIIVIIVVSTLGAAAQGFFFEIFSLAGAVVGYLLAAWEYWRLAPWFEPFVKSAAIANIAAFITIFAFVGILAGSAGKITRWAVNEVGLRWIDRFLGGAFGLVRGLVVVTVLVLAVATFMPQSKWLETSELSRYFLLSARSASWVAPADLRQKFVDGVAYIRKVRMEGLGTATGGLSTNAEKTVPPREARKPQ